MVSSETARPASFPALFLASSSPDRRSQADKAAASVLQPNDVDWDLEDAHVTALVRSWTADPCTETPSLSTRRPTSSAFGSVLGQSKANRSSDATSSSQLVLWTQIPSSSGASFPPFLVTHSTACETDQHTIVVRPTNAWPTIHAKPGSPPPSNLHGPLAMADTPASSISIYVAATNPSDVILVAYDRRTRQLVTHAQASATNAFNRVVPLGGKRRALARFLHAHRLTATFDLVQRHPRAAPNLVLYGMQYNTVARRVVSLEATAQFAAKFGFQAANWTTDATWADVCAHTAPVAGNRAVVIRASDGEMAQTAFTPEHGVYAAWRFLATRKFPSITAPPGFVPRASKSHALVADFASWLATADPPSDFPTLVSSFLASRNLLTASIPSLAAGTDRTLIIPVAIPGAGKTTVARALARLHPTTVAVVQNDLEGPRAPGGGFFPPVVAARLATHKIVVADRNNSVYAARATLVGAVRGIYPAATILYVVWRHCGRAAVQRMVDRIVARGTSHPGLSVKTAGGVEEVKEIVEGFVKTSEGVAKNEVGNVSKVDGKGMGVGKLVGPRAVLVQCDPFAPAEESLGRIWDALMQYADAARGWSELEEAQAKEVVEFVMAAEVQLVEEELKEAQARLGSKPIETSET
ncbi:hypothetical protein GGF31_004871 [Allomyces arbusculus]|nr:hypothetical protein GGF31_004871 [Allomyces arbusculus]